jgi:DNA oxidative demethylase
MPPTDTAIDAPAGLLYEPDLIAPAEDEALLGWLSGLAFGEVRMRGQVARRTVRHFGLDYDFERYRLTPGDPVPEPLLPLRERAAALAGAAPDDLAQVLVSRYPPGAAIGWHRDAPAFDVVIGVSLGAACRMRFQRGSGDERRVFTLDLEPRSGYVLAGEARTAWQHSIPAVRELRYSVTFRTLRNPSRWRPA